MRRSSVILLLAAIVLAYSPCLSAQYLHWDDGKHFFQNPVVFQPSGWPLLKEIFTQTINGTYIPLTVLSFHIEHRLFGLHPLTTHALNVLGHAGIVVLVYRLGMMIGLAAPAALLGAAIFGLHPMHVESVAWATERKDIVCGFFYVLALLLYGDYVRAKKRASYWIALACGVLSILAKPMAVSLPWVLLLIDWFLRRPLNRTMLVDKLPFCALIWPVAAITFFKLGPNPQLVFPDSVLIYCWSMVFYLFKFLFPYPLLPVYAPRLPVLLTNPVYAWSLVTMIGLAIAGWAGRRHRLWVFALLFFSGTIFFFGRFDFADINIVADRFMYLPSVGICLWLGHCARKAPRFLIILILSALSLATFVQCRHWRDDSSLWQWALRHESHNSLVRKKLNALLRQPATNAIDYLRFDDKLGSAPAYNQRGVRLVTQGRMDLAESDFNAAINLNPQLAEAFINRGGVFKHRKKYDRALADYERAIALDPQDSTAYLNKALVLSALGDERQAKHFLDVAVAKNPANARNFFERGTYFASVNQQAAAQKDFEQVLKLDPAHAQAHHEVGMLATFASQPALALQHFNRAIKLAPANDRFLNGRALLFMKFGRYKDALSDLSQAIQVSDEPSNTLITRGDVHRVMGKIPQAIEDYTESIRFNPSNRIAWTKRAKVYFDAGMYQQSLKDMDEVMRLDPADASAVQIHQQIKERLKAK